MLTHVPCLVRLASEECDLLGKLGGQAWLTQVPYLVRLVSEECDSLRGNVPCRSLEGSGHKRVVWSAPAHGGKARPWLGRCSWSSSLVYGLASTVVKDGLSGEP